ncbi:MAG TPA: HAMP domain-containing sensor histidine kinase, partial [Bacteroidota bacterium]|nr:HAMP domain-containing sensor histidine kinase [Bacteroidota bacterium]
NIKILLFITAIMIVVGTLIYTQKLVNQLLRRERETASVYAESLDSLANGATEQVDYSFIFDRIVRQIDFPMILSDPSGKPVEPFRNSSKNIDIDTSLSPDRLEQYLAAKTRELDEENPPIEVYARGAVVQKVHYGESTLVRQLRYLPYVEIAVAGMFILLGYVGFSYIKKSEQGNIWVGMAKETAHQLGTPLSSVMAWIEMLRTRAGTDDRQLETIREMENDLSRIQKVTDRFSKIGSKPNLKAENLTDVVASVIAYYKRRLPVSRVGGSTAISLNSPADLSVPLNRELFEWVIENLIKNALDAMEGTPGSIAFTIFREDEFVNIDIQDTGKGIDMRYKKDIFRPGYSTKQRGWGLGLSLSKRIIEDYHKGKLLVKESRLGKGTTFRIRLRK